MPDTPRTYRILAVDDNAFMKTFYEKAFKDLPVEVAFAADGVEAVRVAGEFRPDLILMDVNMPKMDGVAATRAIRSGPVPRSVPILAVTAVTTGRGEFPGSAEFTGVISKPVQVKALQSAVRTHLRLD